MATRGGERGLALGPLTGLLLGPLADERSRRWTLLSLAIATAIAVPDAATRHNAIPIALLILGPLVASARSTPRGVTVVTLWALALTLGLGAAIHDLNSRNELMRLLVVGAGGVLTIWTTSIRQARERTAELLGAQAATARILSASDTLADAGPRIVEVVCETLGWQLGAVWRVQRHRNAIVCGETWAPDGIDAADLVERSRGAALGRGDGLPGRVWESGQPAWSLNLGEDPSLPRASEALGAGLGASFCFPIRSSTGVVGALEFFAVAATQPDRYTLDLMDALGGQIGEFVERKRAEEAVQDSESRKRAILDAALDCVITIDDQGRVVEFNPAAERTFGYTAEEAIGRELAELIVPPDLRERHRAGLRRQREGGESKIMNRRLELTAVRGDGSELPVEVTITVISRDPLLFAGYVRDLTERRRSEVDQRRLALIVESSEDAILSKDLNGILTSWNAGAERLYGYSAEEAIGKSIRLVIPQELQGEEEKILERVRADQGIDHYETVRQRKDGSRVDVELSVSPIKNAAGTIVGASVIAHDNSERKRAEEQRTRLLQLEQESRVRMQQAERRASFLAEAQAALSASLDYTTTMENLARVSVPYMADWCVVDMAGQDGRPERIAIAHPDPEKEALGRELQSRYAGRPDPDQGALRAIRTGESQLLRQVPDEALEHYAQDEEHLRRLRELGLRSVMTVPLQGRDRVLGAITFVSAESGRLFDEDDLAFAEELAGRAAVAMDNARLYGERSYIASTLQQSLLPDNLPEIPGVELAARYLAAGEGAEVGGDFYDIYRSGESTWGLAIGDVRGKGPRAAAVTALARYALRTASLIETAPSRVLMTLNEAMLRQRSDDRFCTVAYASIQPSPHGGVSIRLGVGGHPLPLLVRRDGTVERVGSPGTLIGLVPDPDIVDDTVELRPGESLVLYTDGVSEARSQEDGLFGEQRLIELLRSSADQHATAIAERIEQRVREFQDHANTDDLAVLVMRVPERRVRKGARKAERIEPARRRAPA